MLFRERAIAVHVARRILRGQQMIELAEARCELVELEVERMFHTILKVVVAGKSPRTTGTHEIPRARALRMERRYDSPDGGSGSW